MLAKRARSLAPHCPPRPLARALSRSMDATQLPAAFNATFVAGQNEVRTSVYTGMTSLLVAQQAARILGAATGEPVKILIDGEPVHDSNITVETFLEKDDAIVVEATRANFKGEDGKITEHVL